MAMNEFPFDEHSENRRMTTYGVIIYLPHNLDNIISPMRDKYDPLYNAVPSHITLVFPFETNRTIDTLTSLLKPEIENQFPITIELDSIDDFYPESPCIFWSLKKNEPLCELYYRLYSKLELPIPVKNYIPHVTIAREISTHRVELVKDKIASYLPKESFVAESVELVTPLISERWVSVRSFPFLK